MSRGDRTTDRISHQRRVGSVMHRDDLPWAQQPQSWLFSDLLVVQQHSLEHDRSKHAALIAEACDREKATRYIGDR